MMEDGEVDNTISIERTTVFEPFCSQLSFALVWRLSIPVRDYHTKNVKRELNWRLESVSDFHRSVDVHTRNEHSSRRVGGSFSRIDTTASSLASGRHGQLPTKLTERPH